MCADTPEQTVEYKDTLNLPKTDFPMRAGLPKREPNWLDRWSKLGVYDRLREKGEGREPFILHDGPPYANGHLHIGHALNKTIKDMVVRSHQMMGHDARYVPGWDCHGLPIEWKIEEQYRKKGKNKDEVNIVDFRQECRKFAEGWIDIQRDEFKRLGITGNWADPYITMDYHAEAVIADEFMKFLMNGTLYQGSKPVMWSPVEKTALAEAEVEYHDKESFTIWVKFKVVEAAVDPKSSLTQPIDSDLLGAHVVIWTTTPWTIPSNKAVVYGSNGEWDDIRDFRAADFVTDTEGTGFVHCAPSHGMEEFELYRDLNMLEQVITYNVMDDGGFRADLPFFGGKFILDRKGKEGNANKTVIDKLVEVGGLLARGKIKHSYPHSWRSKAPIIYRNTPQWFASVDRKLDDGMGEMGDSIRERALNSIDQLVKWWPQSGRNRLHSMIEARPDWVLSRQRAWGVPLTCFTKKDALPTDADYILRSADLNARIKAAFEVDGADVWYTDGFKEKMLDGIANPEEYDQVYDVLDVWFDSGSTHAFVQRDREDGAPDGIADVYLEGTDQHRGWFHSSLLQASGTKGRAPYKNVVTHGFTLDEKGMKMSKSLGNTIVPETVVKQYGADILRLWVAQTDYTADQRIGPEILKGVADSYRRLRNTMRFMLGALDAHDADKNVAAADMPELERWVLHRLAELDHQVRQGYRTFDFQGVFRAVFEFATQDLSAFYFDIRKDALYCDGDSNTRFAALTVMDILHARLTTWLAPILCFTMEEVWLERHPGEDSSVHLVDMPDTPADWLDEPLAAKWAEMRKVRRVVTAALEVQRTDKVIGASLEAAPVVHIRDEDVLALVQSVDFADMCITSSITLTGDPSPAEAFRLPETEGVGVVFEKADGDKCQRCWKILPDVGTHSHP
ncbi:isoleucine--tRNA ligase-like, partial [Amphibalanus amphitrite]|uniref:isoleucine--tRNA ligase-like n=1 Tax=Amphibalanus amphitrite TaxID=1232801 RepID=UPI001C927E5F